MKIVEICLIFPLFYHLLSFSWIWKSCIAFLGCHSELQLSLMRNCPLDLYALSNKVTSSSSALKILHLFILLLPLTPNPFPDSNSAFSRIHATGIHPSLFSVAVTKTRRGVCFILWPTIHHEGKSEQKLSQEPRSRNWSRTTGTLVTGCPPWLAHFSHNLGPHVPRGGTAHSGLSPTISISKKMAHRPLWRRNSSNEVPSSQSTLVCVIRPE